MYSINGIPLDNDTLNWRLLRRSQPILPVLKNTVDVVVPGRHGVLQGVPSFKSPPSATLVVQTPLSGLEALYVLFERNGGRGLLTATADTARAAVFELTSIAPEHIAEEEKLLNVSITMRFPTADWRETAYTTVTPASVTDPVEYMDILSGIGSDVIDADIFIGGNFGNFELLDGGSGSWLRTALTWPHTSGTGLLYVGATGQAFRATNANPWTPTADVSNLIETSGGGGFRISPTWVSTPSDRIARLSLTTTAQSGVTFGFRAKNAYAIRDGDI